MTLRPILTALAEGVAHDSRGQVTLVAAEPSAWQAALPGSLSLFYIVILEDDDAAAPTLVPGRSAYFSMRVFGPDSVVLAFWEQNLVTPPQDPALPARVQLVLPVQIVAQREGVHTITLVTRFEGLEESWSREFRVRQVN